MLIALEWVGAGGIVVIKVLRPYSPAALLIIVLDNKGEQAATSLGFGLVPFAVYFVELPTIFCSLLVVHAFDIPYLLYYKPWACNFFVALAIGQGNGLIRQGGLITL